METATDDNEISFGSSRIINLRDFFEICNFGKLIVYVFC